MFNPEGPQPQYTQSISATVRLCGPQGVRVNTHGVGGPGSHIAVATDTHLIYVHDVRAAATYCRAFTEPAPLAARLPQRVYVPRHTAGPGLNVRAHGEDRVAYVIDARTGALLVQVGRISFYVQDQDAWADLTAAWSEVRDLAPVVFRRRY